MPRPTRVAVRVVLLDPASRVLLFEGRDLSDAGDTVRFWFTAGGGVEDGEALEAAAERELREEMGLSGLRLIGPFDRRDVDFLDHGEPLHRVEHFFAARTADVALQADGWTDLERRALTAWRWWSVDELRTAGVRYFPDDLVALVPVAESLLRASEHSTGPAGPAADRPDLDLDVLVAYLDHIRQADQVLDERGLIESRPSATSAGLPPTRSLC